MFCYCKSYCTCSAVQDSKTFLFIAVQHIKPLLYPHPQSLYPRRPQSPLPSNKIEEGDTSPDPSAAPHEIYARGLGGGVTASAGAVTTVAVGDGVDLGNDYPGRLI